MKKKKTRAKILLFLALISLFILGIFFFPKGKKERESSSLQEKREVLGERIENLSPSPSPFSLERYFQNTLENTKEIVSKEVITVEKNLRENFEKEISQLTQAQIDFLKRQICTQWGVISPLPTPSSP